MKRDLAKPSTNQKHSGTLLAVSQPIESPESGSSLEEQLTSGSSLEPEYGSLEIQQSLVNQAVSLVTQQAGLQIPGSSLEQLNSSNSQQLDGRSSSPISASCPLCRRQDWKQLEADLWRLELWLDQASRILNQYLSQVIILL